MSNHNRSKPGRPSRRDLSTRSVEFFTRPKQSLPVILGLVVWRWRWELTTLTTLYVVYTKLRPGLSAALTITLMAATLAALVTFPPTRRFLRTRMWCVICRHRLRSCMAEMRTLNYSGNLPFIVHTHGTKVGEATWLWMRPGLSVTDLDNRSEHLAAACWARDARIQRNRRMAALVRVDIIRRDPLSAASITSPLLGSTAQLPSTPLEPDRALHLATSWATTPPSATGNSPVMTEQPARPTPSKKKTKTTTTTTAAAADAGSVVLLNGEDVSDYV
ncbi:MAG: hypothetical protein ACRDQ2_05730 [Gaiellales bacterium]